MSDRIDVSENEHGVIRLFTLSSDTATHDNFAQRDVDHPNTPSPLEDALGATQLNPDYVEIFDIRDLDELGLTGYMIEGLGVAEAKVNEDCCYLQGLRGKIVVVLSKAFNGTSQTLTLRAPLHWVGTYTEETPPVTFEPLPNGSARGNVTQDSKPKPSDAAMSGRIAMLALLVICAITVLIVGLSG